MSFISELKRRNIFKVAVAYVILSWVILQVASIAFPALKLPEWTMTMLIVFTVIGFPFVMLFAWAFELTPDGIKPTKEVSTSDSIRTITGQKINSLVIAGLALALCIVIIDSYVLKDSPTTNESEISTLDEPNLIVPEILEAVSSVLPNSVAVLPFSNLSPNAEDAFFASGLHEEILNQLAKLSNLKIISRTSVLRYIDSGLSIPEIAAELNVGTIMEGSVRFAGNQIRVTTQLIDAATDEHLWSETYERDFENIFAIESDIAMNVANAMLVEFSLEEQARIEKAPTASPEAYALYLRARVEFQESTLAGADMLDTLSLINSAIDIDPQFALAYAYRAGIRVSNLINTTAGNADILDTEGDWQEKQQEAIADAEYALSLDPELGLAHDALGLLHLQSWRWPESSAAFEQGYSLSPNDAIILADYTFSLSFAGASQKAVRMAESRIELEPGISGAYTYLGVAHAYAGNLQSATNAYRQAILIEPNDLLARQHLALLEAVLGNNETAEIQLRAIEAILGENRVLVLLPELAMGYSMIGLDAETGRLMAEILAVAEQREVGAGTLAMAYLATDDQAKVIDQLEIAVDKNERHEPDEGFYSLMIIKHNLIEHPILEEPRLQELRSQLGVL